MRKTKIVCTIGPSSQERDTLLQMIKAGMNVARINFSHGTHEEHKKVIDLIHEIRDDLGIPLAVLLDTKGPEIRTGELCCENVLLEAGKSFTLTTDVIKGNDTRVSVTYKDLPSQLDKGNTVLIDDGRIKLIVEDTDKENVYCRVINGGELGTHKGVNIPNVHIDMPYLSEKDKSDLLFGIENNVDFIAASFIRCRQDVDDVRKFINYNGGHDIKIIAKIENTEGIENFDEILESADGIMVARGDMGVEVEFERLPGLQKKFIKRCYQSGKIVITATQMLESMINSPNPTRAEITDVANAVFDGTSAVMLSGETAMGKYPVVAVNVMHKIAKQAEKDSFDMGVYKHANYEMDASDTTNAMCDAACTTARDIKAKAIISLTMSGQTARRMSKFRPFEPIVAATPIKKTYHQLALSWGVYPVFAKHQKDSDSLFVHAVDCARQIDVVGKGDMVVIAAGIPTDMPGNTNTIRVQTVDY